MRDLYAAYLACRRGKRQTHHALDFAARLLDHLLDLRNTLNARTWRPGPTLCFAVNHPKPREIHAASFADRVVHHWLVPRLEAWFEPAFLYDSYANRRGKGTHAAVARLHDFLQQVTRSGRVKAYYLQLDIANFFNSIDRGTLLGLVQARAQRYWRGAKTPGRGANPDTLPAQHREINTCLWLTRVLLTREPAVRARVRGSEAAFRHVPAHKRLKNAAPGCGLPIGNLTSQFFANVYLDRLDQFVKHELRCRFYLRYVDDFVLLHTDARQLIAWREAIANFLAQELFLALKVVAEPQATGQGINFLGYAVRRTYKLPRRRVLDQAEKRLTQARAQRVREDATGRRITWPAPAREHLRATLASTLGHLRHAASRRLLEGLAARHTWLESALRIDPARGCLLACFAPPDARCFAGQIKWFRRQFPQALLALRKGCEYELWPPAALQPQTLAAARLPHFLRRLRQAGQAYVRIEQEAALRRRLKRRVVAEAFYPAEGGSATLPQSVSGV
ncbi:MAG: reverse transcriptase [Betaproteobacteria bacterium]|nr:reverse transcriptase [Betaproteobacteria bacterium]